MSDDLFSQKREDELHRPEPRENLRLRVPLRRGLRVRKRAVLIAVGGGMLTLFSLLMVALAPKPPRERVSAPLEVERSRPPEAIDQLPSRYSDIKLDAEPVIPLGPPLPGDLGGTILKAEVEADGSLPFRPDPVADAERAARIRAAKRAEQALESGVFFKRTSGAGDNETAGAAPAEPRLPQGSGSRVGLPGPVSPYRLLAGTVIPASLVSGIQSDRPGPVVAQVTTPVYDSVTGRHLLIPQGARLIGRYDSGAVFGDRRVMLVWDRLILPDGTSLDLGGLKASDRAGYAGLEDDVDYHGFEMVKGVALASLLGVGSELTFGDDERDVLAAFRRSLQESTSDAGDRIVDRALGMKPTLTVRPGWPLTVIVTEDLTIKPFNGDRS